MTKTTEGQETGNLGEQMPAMPNNSTFANTSDGFLQGVEPAKSPDQIRAEQQAANQPPPQQPQTNGQRMFSEAEVETFRRQEKEKLYPRIEEMQKTVQQLQAERDERIAAEEAARKAAEEEARKKAEEEMDVRQLLQQTRAEFEAELAKTREEAATAQALLQRERELQELQAYRQAAIAANQEHLVPEIVDYISGSSREEIDASIQGAIERSGRMIQSVAAVAQQQYRAMPGPRVTQPGIGPMEEQQEQRALTAADIAAMPMSEYMKHRGTLHAGASQQFYGNRQ